MQHVREQRESLRQRLRAERSALGPAEVRAASDACCRHAAPLFANARVVALYSATGGEIDSAPLAATLATEASVVWPRVESEQKLSFCPGPLQPGRFEISAPPALATPVDPDQIDAFVVPGLAFDAAGNRLGYGRGYYDSALSAAPRALRVGLCHAFQLVDAVPPRDGDEPMDYIVTPDGARPTGARRLKETP